MVKDPNSAKDRCQVRVWVASSPQVQAGERLHLSGKEQAGHLPKAHPGQAGTWLPGSPGQREKSGPGKPHSVSHDTAPCYLEPPT